MLQYNISFSLGLLMPRCSSSFRSPWSATWPSAIPSTSSTWGTSNAPWECSRKRNRNFVWRMKMHRTKFLQILLLTSFLFHALRICVTLWLPCLSCVVRWAFSVLRHEFFISSLPSDELSIAIGSLRLTKPDSRAHSTQLEGAHNNILDALTSFQTGLVGGRCGSSAVLAIHRHQLRRLSIRVGKLLTGIRILRSAWPKYLATGK